ncbi:uncharacterized protein EV422DRAFT_515051 [Fimicolochytrium jonesii]|uniref:uncharacterized protein n=1 Tax=Fimicolochytrium jonesii TaxID=1396493 RepID=UPI0022FF3FF3|nr:uncharacterized protein EV422DRAFT_515051 [Fimicolochytrium jonesii]KAI8826028.1 hypothetical protein EV422DRAFT_515051 [Fimicolochytrium jonesii]
MSSKEPITSISVPTATNQTAPTPHTTYTVSLRGTNGRTWTTNKRYSEFAALFAALVADLGQPPAGIVLPPKHFSIFGSTMTDPVKIEERRRGLEAFLRSILYCNDPKWRRTGAWMSFLGIGGESADAGSVNGTHSRTSSIASSTSTLLNPNTSFTPAEWMTEYHALKSLTRDIRAHVTTRDRCAAAGDVQGAQSAGVAGKQGLRGLESRTDALEKSLTVHSTTSLPSEKLAKGELMRRQDLLGGLVGEIEGIARSLSSFAMSSAASSRNPLVGDPSRGNAGLTPQQALDRQSLLSSPSSSRRFGTHSASTATASSADPQQLLLQQKDIMTTQDDALDSLSGIIRRQKEIGVAIGHELDLQNGLLGEVDEQVDRVQSRLKGTGKKLDKVLKG